MPLAIALVAKHKQFTARSLDFGIFPLRQNMDTVIQFTFSDPWQAQFQLAMHCYPCYNSPVGNVLAAGSFQMGKMHIMSVRAH